MEETFDRFYVDLTMIRKGDEFHNKEIYSNNGSEKIPLIKLNDLQVREIRYKQLMYLKQHPREHSITTRVSIENFFSCNSLM